MKKILIASLLLSSLSFAHANQQDDEDEIAAEKIGMTLEGYRSSSAYKAKKPQAARVDKQAEKCNAFSGQIDEAQASLRSERRGIDRTSDELGQVRSSLEFRFNLLNSTTSNYGNLTASMRDQYKRDEANYNSQLAAWRRDRDTYNRHVRSSQSDVERYNGECADK